MVLTPSVNPGGPAHLPGSPPLAGIARVVSLARAAITNHERGDLLTLARKMEMDNLVPGAFKACPRISMCAAGRFASLPFRGQRVVRPSAREIRWTVSGVR